MKKFIIILSVLVFSCIFLLLGACETEPRLVFMKVNNEYVVVNGRGALSGDVVIPSEYKGKPVTRIENFSYWDEIVSIYIPDTISEIDSDAFGGCYSLKTFIVSENNPKYCAIDGHLYNKNGTVLIRYAIGQTNTTFEIPQNVMVIGTSAFENIENLTNIILPYNLDIIYYHSFYKCANLTELIIPHSVTMIYTRAISDCTDLEVIYCEGSMADAEEWAEDWNENNVPIVWDYIRD